MCAIDEIKTKKAIMDLRRSHAVEGNKDDAKLESWAAVNSNEVTAKVVADSKPPLS